MRPLPFAITLACILTLACSDRALARGALDLTLQAPRPTRLVDTATIGFGRWPTIASAGDRTAIVYTDETAGPTSTVHVVLSDGRGLLWSPPIRLDSDPSIGRKLTQTDSVLIEGASIYVAWRDERYGLTNDEVYFACSRDDGATWQPERRIDKGHPAGTGGVKCWRMAASGDDVYVLLTVDPNGPAVDELYLIASHDAGATFAPPIPINTGSFGVADVDPIAIATFRRVVYIAWADDRHRLGFDDVYCRTSVDAGVTIGPEVQADASGPGVGDAEFYIEIAAEIGLAAVAWIEKNPSTRELHVALTADAGASFLSDARVGEYVVGVHDVTELDVAIHEGSIYAAWSDDRYGNPHVFVASSIDVGTSWRPDVHMSPRASFKPRLAGAGRDVALAWQDTPLIAGAARIGYTTDRGATWITDVAISDHQYGANFPEVAFNPLYRNFLATWVNADRGTNRCYVGGLRPQTCRAHGFVAGPTHVEFQLESFRPADGLGWVLLAATPGTLPLFLLGDPRDVGVAADDLFVLSGSTPGVFSVALVDGAGLTPRLPTTLPSGASLVYCALALRPDTGILDLSDVRTIQM